MAPTICDHLISETMQRQSHTRGKHAKLSLANHVARRSPKPSAAHMMAILEKVSESVPAIAEASEICIKNEPESFYDQSSELNMPDKHADGMKIHIKTEVPDSPMSELPDEIHQSQPASPDISHRPSPFTCNPLKTSTPPPPRPPTMQCRFHQQQYLMAIAIRTIKLLQRNRTLQIKLAQLKAETSQYISTVMANQERTHDEEATVFRPADIHNGEPQDAHLDDEEMARD